MHNEVRGHINVSANLKSYTGEGIDLFCRTYIKQITGFKSLNFTNSSKQKLMIFFSFFFFFFLSAMLWQTVILLFATVLPIQNELKFYLYLGEVQ